MKAFFLSFLISLAYATHAPEPQSHPVEPSVDNRIQVTLDEILAQFPDLKGRLPIDLAVKNTTDNKKGTRLLFKRLKSSRVLNWYVLWRSGNIVPRSYSEVDGLEQTNGILVEG